MKKFKKQAILTVSLLILCGIVTLNLPASDYSGLERNLAKHKLILTKLIDQMKSSAQIDMSVQKVSVQSLLGRESKNSGEISMTNSGKFWWSIIKPEPSLLVFDGKFAWSEERLPEDFGGGYKVAKSDKFQNSPAYKILRVLMGHGKIEEFFSPLRILDDGKKVSLQLTPIDKNWNLSLVKIVIDKTSNQLLQIEYTDDLENISKLSFSKHQSLKTVDSKKFNYVPPKGAQVTEL